MTAMLSLTSRQNLTISPRMQQAIRLLRLSAIEFEHALRDAVASNPFLEASEETTPVASAAALEDPLPVTPEPMSEPTSSVIEPASAGPAESFAFEAHSAPRADTEGPQLSWVAAPQNLRDHLRQQLYASRCTEREVLIGEIVIESLDDDGYLRDELDPQALGIEIEPAPDAAELEAALHAIRCFDPPGVGARSLVECLLLQLAMLDPQTPQLPLARRILVDHLDVLTRRDFYVLRRRLDCDEEAMRAALLLIRSLNPDPASRFSAKATDYVVPDIIVQCHGERFVATINPVLANGPRLNDTYIELFRGCRRSQHPQMSQQLQEARWFVRNVAQRFETIFRVAEYIVDRQQDFFRLGDIALKPMVLREVANELGLHESTVSRATGNKFLASPRGCFEFKHFFSRELQMRQGPSCSATAVRSLIQDLIANEQRESPLSDVDIAARLQSQGVSIARRTVTKYRRMMKLPPAEFRKVS